MGIRFIETNLVGEGWLTRVCDGDTPVGHIRQNPRTGSFRYFRGLENKLTVALERESLASLKRALVCSQLGM
jgi:hypothetical protein